MLERGGGGGGLSIVAGTLSRVDLSVVVQTEKSCVYTGLSATAAERVSLMPVI